MSSPALTLQSKPRPLAARDLDRVVWIDASLRAARARRTSSAASPPRRAIPSAICSSAWRPTAASPATCSGARSKASSDAPSRSAARGLRRGRRRAGTGLGAALLKAFEDEAARRGLRQVRTTALWREHALLAFFDRAGFRLSPVHVLDCALDEAELGSAREAPVEPGPGPPIRTTTARRAPRTSRRSRATRSRSRCCRRPTSKRGAHRPPPYRPGPPRLSVPHRRRGARRFGAARVARGAHRPRARRLCHGSPGLRRLRPRRARRGDRHDRRRSAARAPGRRARCCRSSSQTSRRSESSAWRPWSSPVISR